MAPPTATSTNAYQIVISASDRASGIVAGVTNSLTQIGTTIGGSVRPAFAALTTTMLGFFGAGRSGFSDIISLIERTDSLLRQFAGITLKEAISGFAQSIVADISNATQYSLTQILQEVGNLGAVAVGIDIAPSNSVQRQVAEIRGEILSLNGIALRIDLERDTFAAIAREIEAIAQAAARAESLGISLNIDDQSIQGAAAGVEALSARLNSLKSQGITLRVQSENLTDALTQLEGLAAAATELGDRGASLTLETGSLVNAQRQLEELAIELAGLRNEGIELPIAIDPERVAGQTRELVENVDALANQGITIDLSLGNVRSVDQQLANLENQLIDLTAQGVDLTVGVEGLAASRSQIEILQGRLDELASAGVAIDLDLESVGTARQQIAEVEGRLNELGTQGIELPVNAEQLRSAAFQLEVVAERVEALGQAGIAITLDPRDIAAATQQVINLGDRLSQLETQGVEVSIQAQNLEVVAQQAAELEQAIAALESSGVALSLDVDAVEAARAVLGELGRSVEALGQAGATIDLDAGTVAQVAEQVASLQEQIEALEQQGIEVDLNPTTAAFQSAADEIRALSGEAQAFIENTLGQAPQAVLQSVASATAFAVNGLDRAFLALQAQYSQFIEEIEGVGSVLSDGFLSLSGAEEALDLFEGLQNVVTPAIESIAQVGLQITYFTSLLDALQPIVASGPYRLLIDQNVQLQEQLLATQSTLAATNEVLRGGQVVGDPTAAIQSLEGPVNEAIDRIRKGSLELVGVTSSQLIESFQIIAGEAGSIGISLTEASDLTLSFAAALGTLGIPLFQARQEIGSILQGQIDQNSVLAKSLNLTNQQVAQYREQGRLFEFLTSRLQAFRAGNELAAKSLGGVTSNIQEIFENIGLAAGERILEPLVDQITGVYDLLQSNQGAITTFVTGIAESLFDALLNLSEGIGDLFTTSRVTIINTVTVLFSALTGAINALGNALSIAATVLEPFFNILGGLSGLANLLNPLFQVGITLKVLTATVGGLAGAFAQFARGLPIVGEALFLMQIRSSGLIGLLTGLGGAAGTGAAGFLTLGANLTKVPFLFDAIASRIPVFGSQIAALIPAISTGGIALLGLTQKFPILGQALQTFQGQIPQIAQGLVSFAKGNAALEPYAPLFQQLADRVTQYGDATNLTALANQRFGEIAKSVRTELIATGIRIAAITGGVFVAAVAFNEFVLKNEALVDLLKEIGAGLGSIAGLVADVLTNPMLLAATAAATLTAGLVLMRTQLAALIQLQLGQFALGAAGALGQLATTLKGLQLVGLAGGAQQAALGLQALSIAFTAGTAEAKAFLVASNVQTVTLRGLRTAIVSSIASLRGFIVAQSQAAVTMLKQFPASIAASIASLRGLNLASSAGIIGFLGLGTSSGAAATGVAATGVAAGGAAVGFGALAASIGATIAGLAVLLAPIAAVVATIGLIGLGLRGVQLGRSRKEVEALGRQTEATSARSLALADQLKAAQERQNEADEKGIALSRSEYQENIRLQEQASEQIALLDRQIAAAERAQKSARGEGNKNAVQAQIDELKRLKETLGTLSSEVEIEPKDLPRLGTLLEQLNAKAAEARTAITNSAGDPEVFNRQAQALIEFNQQLLELGAIDGTQARKEFELIATSANADIETITSALQAVTASFEVETKAQVAIVSTRQAQIEEQVLEGVITETEGQRQITDAQREQLAIQLDNLRAAKDEEVRILQQNRQNTLDELNRQLAEAQTRLNAALGDPTAAQTAADQAIAGFEAQRRTLLIQLETAQQEVESLQASGGRGGGIRTQQELRQARSQAEALEQQLSELNGRIDETRSSVQDVKPDPAAAEAARADIAAINERIVQTNETTNNAIGQSNREFAQQEAENQRDDAKLIAEARQQELDRAQQRAVDAAKAAETSRLIELQRLENAGVVSQSEVEAERLNATQDRIAAEIEAEQAKLEGLLENEKANASEIRESRQRIADLTLQSLENEEKAYEQHLERIRDAIRKQQLDVEIGLQEGLNAGVVSQAQAEEARANLTIQRLQQEIELETRSAGKRKELQLQLLQAEQKAYEARNARILESVERQQTQAQILLQRGINQGLVTQEAAEEARLQLAVRRLQQEIALETQNADKREALTLRLLETEGRLRDAQIKTIEAELTQAAQRYANQLEQQNQKLIQQQTLYDALGRSLDAQNRLLEAARDLQAANADYVASSLGILGDLERSDFRRQQLAQITAAIQLESLQSRQQLEIELFNIQQEQNRLALERREIENQIAIARASAEIAQGEADIRVAEQRRRVGQITQEEFDAVVIQQRANLTELSGLLQEQQLIQREGQVQGSLEAVQRQQLSVQQQSAQQQALAQVVQTLPPGLQQRAARQLQAQIINGLTGGLAQDARQFREQGTATVRAIVDRELFGRGDGGNLLGGLIQDSQQQSVQSIADQAAQIEEPRQLEATLPPELQAVIAGLDQTIAEIGQRPPIELPPLEVRPQIEIPSLQLPPVDAATRPTLQSPPPTAIAPTQAAAPTFTPDQLQQISDAIWSGQRGLERSTPTEQAAQSKVEVQAPITVNVTESATSEQVLGHLERVVDRAGRLAASSR